MTMFAISIDVAHTFYKLVIQDKSSPFMQRLLDKGRMRSIMHSFPIHVVMKEDLGLRGAHIVATRLAAMAEQPTPLSPTKSPSALNGSSSKAARGSYGRGQNSNHSLADSMRSAVVDYPLAYAAFVSLTAGFTATAVTIGGRFLNRTQSPSSS